MKRGKVQLVLTTIIGLPNCIFFRSTTFNIQWFYRSDVWLQTLICTAPINLIIGIICIVEGDEIL